MHMPFTREAVFDTFRPDPTTLLVRGAAPRAALLRGEVPLCALLRGVGCVSAYGCPRMCAVWCRLPWPTSEVRATICACTMLWARGFRWDASRGCPSFTLCQLRSMRSDAEGDRARRRCGEGVQLYSRLADGAERLQSADSDGSG